MKISPSVAMIVYAGIALTIIGFILLSFGTFSDSDTAFGGLVMIGPIPIVFGSNPYMTALSMIAGIVLMLLYFTMWKKHGQLEADYSIENADADDGNDNDNDNIREKSVRGGGVVMIGPIPIIIGTDSKSAIIVLSIVLTILLLKLAFG